MHKTYSQLYTGVTSPFTLSYFSCVLTCWHTLLGLGLFYSVTFLSVLADRISHFLRVSGPGHYCLLESTLSRFLRVFGPGLYCLLESTLSRFLRDFGPGLYCPLESTVSRILRVFGPELYRLLESSRQDQLLRPHSRMPTFNLLAPVSVCALQGVYQYS